jgi:DNA-binding GntR family transcriptional regulator
LAIKQLATEGLLEVQQGRGTFVAPPKQRYNPTEDFAEQFELLEKTVQTRLIDTRWLAPHRDAAQVLRLGGDEKVWSVFMLHSLDGLPASAQVLDIPRSLAEHFLGDSRKARSVFRVLRQELGYRKLDIDVISVDVLLEKYYHNLLETPTGVISYEIRRVVSCKGEPLMLSYVALRSDKFSLDFSSRAQGFSIPCEKESDAIVRKTHREAMRERLTEEVLSGS